MKRTTKTQNIKNITEIQFSTYVVRISTNKMMKYTSGKEESLYSYLSDLPKTLKLIDLRHKLFIRSVYMHYSEKLICKIFYKKRQYIWKFSQWGNIIEKQIK